MRPLRRLGFLTIGLFDPDEPAAGHEETLRVIELGEALGFDSAWLRHRHLQFGISSPVTMMAAASQRTSRIELGTAVTPLGAENPFRLAEDLATFLNNRNEFTEFTDDSINASIFALEGDLRYWSSCLMDYKGK